MSGITPRDWGPVLSLLNSLVLSSGQLKGDLTTEMLSTRWCGALPATAEEIAAAEKRLGVMLPPSYRAFLSATNGWPLFDSLVERLLPVEQIEWLRYADPTTLSSIQGMEED